MDEYVNIMCASDQYNKICGIFTDYETMEKKLLAQARMLNHQVIAFDFDEKLNERSMEELISNPEIRLFDIHSRISPNRLEVTDEFERTYKSTDALRWYSKDCFLFSSLNKCMRKQTGNVYDCDMVLFAVDLSTQIQLEWQKQRKEINGTLDLFHVYRGSNLPDMEINRIQNYRDKSITVKGFLSTTKSLNVARMFAANVVFDIEIDPKLENIIYADISTYSYIPDEEEILIDFDTSFRVADVVLDPMDNCWTVHLVSVNETEELIDAYINTKRSEQEDDIMIATGLVFFGHKDRACRLLKESLNSIDDNTQKIDIQCELGEIYTQSGEFTLAADHLREAHNLCTLFNPNYYRFHAISFWLAVMYTCLNDYHQALDHLAIRLEFPDPTPYSLPRLCSTSWTYSVTNEESLRFDPYRVAYEYLQMRLLQYKQNEDTCCKIHFCLGVILLKCGKEDITLQSLDESLLHIKASGHLLSAESTKFRILYYYYIGVIYESKEHYNKAKRYYRKIASILNCNGEQSENLTIIHVRIATCYAVQKLYTLAIQQYMRAFQHSIENGESILVGKVRAHLAICYLKAKQYNEALEQFIAVTALLDVTGRPFVEEIYLIIAETLLKINDTSEATTYYSKFLDRYDEIERDDCELWFDTCERIILTHLSYDQFDCSIVYAKKMLDSRIKKYPDYFEEIMNTQLMIGLCYHRSNDFQEAINYYKMAYDTLAKKKSSICTEEDDPLISYQGVLIQCTISIIYQAIHDYDLAISHANITLEAEEKRLSRDKITIASCYDFIGWCYYLKSEYDKALEFCTKGLHVLHTCASENDVRCCNIHHSLAAIWLELGDLKQSFSYCTESIRILTRNPDYENQKILTYFFLLLDRIRKRQNNASVILDSPEGSSDTSEPHGNAQLSFCPESVEVLQSERFVDMTSVLTMLASECNSGENVQKQSCFPSEDDIRRVLRAISFKVIGCFNEDNSLHTIQIQETEQPSALLYPMLSKLN
ncbi:unnamed protein product [Didymodactylos carnosus]|uniref:NAD(P)(+)--arginine ADP-ribosyltransferase n=1 Tax=Didymodactylos carnosus TaxID=1234261 RepID=A0A8S2CM92_9BILA|nr:unnamed protein product [Didymodactylos carnosus]CAF3525822.1 unnamed protein product [Didymodactylos carnosus]